MSSGGAAPPTTLRRRQAILGRRVGDVWQRHYRDSGFFRRLWASDEPQTLPGTDQLRPRLAVAVRTGGELLGSDWVSEASRRWTRRPVRRLPP